MPDNALNRIYAAEKAQAYDHRMRDAIPGYEALHQLACVAMAEATGGHGRILVVGAGTGAECLALAKSCPGLSVTGVDPSADMVAVAARKIEAAGLGGQVSLHPCPLGDLPEQEPFDGASLLLVLHFLADDGAKLDLLEQTARRLKPGAPLVLADLFGPPWTDPWQGRLRTMWRHLQLAAGIPASDADRGFAHVDRDIHPITDFRLAALLAQAGFTPPQPFFRALCFGAWICQRG